MSEFDNKGKSTVFLVDHGMRDIAQINIVFGKSIALDLRFLREVYGITISALDHVDDDPEYIKIYGLYQADMWMSLQVLRQEIVKYPPDFIRAYIKKARLASWLSKPHPTNENRQIDIGGLANPSGYICLGQDYRDESFTRQTTHHEIEHSATLAEEWVDDKEEVDKWLSYNPRKLGYIGDRYWDIPESQRRIFKTKGFASLYGRKDVLEDRATVAEILMANPEEAYKRGENDSELKSKVEHLKGDYARRTNGKMGERYFDDLASGRVREDYWRVGALKRLFVSCWAGIDYYSGAYRQTFKQLEA